MLFEIEFFRRTKAVPSGKAISREKVDLIDHEAAKAYGLSNRPEEADGFRIYVKRVPKGEVSVRPDKHDV
jgi:hypothetical protein